MSRWRDFLLIVSSIAGIISVVPFIPWVNVGPLLVRFFPFVIFIVMSVVVGAFYFETARVRSENRSLLLLVHQGLQITKNCATVKIDIANKKYLLIFEKHFRVLVGRSPQWYKAQFYCNKYLTDDQKTQEFYGESSPNWTDLKVKAILKEKTDNGKYSIVHRLKVRPVTTQSFYIPFHIDFVDVEHQEENIAMACNSEWVLQYSYEVSAFLWGNYLNRSLSYFGEVAHVVIEHSMIEQIPEVVLYNVLTDGRVERRSTHKETNIVGDTVCFEIELFPQSCARYRVVWDSQALMGIPPTEMGPDLSRMTDF